MQVWLSEMVDRSIPRRQLNKDDIDDVASSVVSTVALLDQQIQSSSKEVLKDEKNRRLKLEDMTKKQRRAAEYRLMREAESQSSKFITRWE